MVWTGAEEWSWCIFIYLFISIGRKTNSTDTEQEVDVGYMVVWLIELIRCSLNAAVLVRQSRGEAGEGRVGGGGYCLFRGQGWNSYLI